MKPIFTPNLIPRLKPLVALPPDRLDKETLTAIDGAFADISPENQMNVEQFRERVCVSLLSLPTMSFTMPLFQKIDKDNSGFISKKQLQNFWTGRFCLRDGDVNIFGAMSRTTIDDYLWPGDLSPFVREFVSNHPFNKFLNASPEFQKRYADTITARIMYGLDRENCGKITRLSVKRSRLLEAWTAVESESDVSSVSIFESFFSYEHFYVLYVTFWGLDTDNDFLVDAQDLRKYNNHTLSSRALDRVFSEVGRNFSSDDPSKMGFDDFIWFLLNEEDKTSPQSIAYWFSIVDLDGDGVIRDHEMSYFYEEQLDRLEALQQEVVPIEDILCQLNDMILPRSEGQYRLSDLKRNPKGASVLFNCLISLNKFLEFELRDPFADKQEQLEMPDLSDWQKFCKMEYDRIAGDGEDEEDEELGVNDDDEDGHLSDAADFQVAVAAS